MNNRLGIHRTALLAVAVLALTATLSAQGRGTALPPLPPPPLGDADTLPPSKYFGVTEYDLARIKLEKLVKPGGFAVYIVTDMEGLAGVVNNGREMSTGRSGNSPDHQRFLSVLPRDKQGEIVPEIRDFPEFACMVLGWDKADLIPTDQLDSLDIPLPEYNESLRPTFAARSGFP